MAKEFFYRRSALHDLGDGAADSGAAAVDDVLRAGEARSERRNNTVLAIPSGVRQRPVGIADW